ncbi:hypothetical protein A8F95_08680 [Bacillus wudalianchiensis]|uniref:Uncharacterized protein n=2 Tax=Pseudobacillus wudalianchiensis TaxID=1743143 RepID=A0A1B9AUA4_9BACI|nr:hypothetical protein A8F95_08680 [Bacillus wudalianchiensis]
MWFGNKSNREVKVPESAFKGAVLEGRERRYTVINERDVTKYVPEGAREDFNASFNNICDWIEEGRIEDGKKPFNSYIVINTDEPYIGEIIEVMKRHGHFR